MNQFTIVTHAVLVGLTPLIPLPVLDDLVRAFFFRRLVQALAAAHGLTLSADEAAALTEERGRGCLDGCLFGAVEYLIKRLVRKVIFVLEWRRAVDLATHAYYVGHLLDYAFGQGWYAPGDAARAARLRAAIEQARDGANTGLVRRVVQSSFDQSRAVVLSAVRQVSESVQDIAFRRSRLWLRRSVVTRLRPRAPRLARWLYRRLRPSEADLAQAARVEQTVAQNLTRETPRLNTTLGDLVAGLQSGLTALPHEHFDLLEARLAKAWQSAGG
jgi:hypothetical protein